MEGGGRERRERSVGGQGGSNVLGDEVGKEEQVEKEEMRVSSPDRTIR